MPKMNGVEVDSLLRARMPIVPVVVYTMFEDVLGKSLTATLGIAAIVSKSDGLTRLLARIEALLESPTSVQPPAGSRGRLTNPLSALAQRPSYLDIPIGLLTCAYLVGVRIPKSQRSPVLA